MASIYTNAIMTTIFRVKKEEWANLEDKPLELN